MKKAYALLITIFLLTLFMSNLVFIFQNKNIKTYNTQNNYLHTQAKIHLDFLQNYVKNLNLKTKCIKNIKVRNDFFMIEAFFNYNCTKYTQVRIDLFVSYKNNNRKVSLHKEIILNKNLNNN